MAALKMVAFSSPSSTTVTSLLHFSPKLTNKYSLTPSRFGTKYLPFTGLVSHNHPVFTVKVSRNNAGDAEGYSNMASRSSADPPEITLTARIIQLLNLPLRMLPLTTAIGTLPWRHGERGTWCAMGILVSIWISRYLKKLINQPRPTSAHGLRVDPGMPSSHAQCFLYITTYGALALIDSQGPHVSTFGLGVLIILFGVFVAWTRILEGVHTYAQAMVGGILGSFIAISWHYLWKIIELMCLPTFIRFRMLLHVGVLIMLLKITIDNKATKI